MTGEQTASPPAFVATVDAKYAIREHNASCGMHIQPAQNGGANFTGLDTDGLQLVSHSGLPRPPQFGSTRR